MTPLRLLLNVLWIITGGIWMAAGWILAALVMLVSIIGIPWAWAAFRIAAFHPPAVRPSRRPPGPHHRPRRSRHRAGGLPRQRDLAAARRLVAGARSPDRRGPPDDHRDRHSLRLGASEACRPRTLARRQRDRAHPRNAGAPPVVLITERAASPRRQFDRAAQEPA